MFKDGVNYNLQMETIGVDTFYANEFHNRHINESTLIKKFGGVYINKDAVDGFSEALMTDGYIIKQFEWHFIAWSDNTFVSFQSNSSGLHDCVVIYTSKTGLNRISDILNHYSDGTKRIQINWYHSNDYEEVFDISDRVVKDSLYPFINGGVQQYIQNYIASKENILILIGPPGTGKTTFIRSVVSAIDKIVYLSYDMNILSKDYVFSSFVADEDAGSFVIEDADLLMGKRKNGNDHMAKLLNVGDGLITLNKKMIFSTNIENINDIDPAIIRPGRCYDVIKFREMNYEEARNLVADYNLAPIIEVKKTYNLAELFNRKESTVKQSFGFMGAK